MKKILVIGYGFVTSSFIERYKNSYNIDVVSERDDISDLVVANKCSEIQNVLCN